MRSGQGQTLIDVAVERTGKVQTVWELAVAQGVSITDLVEMTDCAELGEGVSRNRRVVRRYIQNGTHPATELTEGIGGWRIGFFIIS